MRDIKVGYFDLQEKEFISDIVINNNFIRLLARHVKLITIPINKYKDIKDAFSKLGEYKLDYLYIDSYNFLVESFLLREKFELDIPFILTLHTVFSWRRFYIYLVPLIRKYDIIYAPSRYAREAFLRISDKFNIRVIPPCLDTNSIQNNIPGKFKKDIKLITFMGRVIEEKGVGILIKCMPEIISGAGDVHLNIIGPLSGERTKDKPKSKYVKSLEMTVRQLRLTNRVHFKGAQFGLSKYKILSESDVFVNPTTALGESFSIANLEALTCAVPVITTDWGANNELVRNGENGFLVDINYDQDKNPQVNTGQLISAILKTFKNKQLRHRIKENALNIARNYDYLRVLPQLVRLLKKKPQGRPRERWDLIKDKTVADFRSSFSKDCFSFIILDAHFRRNTYSTYYRNLFSTPSRATKRMPRPKGRALAIVKRLRKNFKQFLLLQSN